MPPAAARANNEVLGALAICTAALGVLALLWWKDVLRPGSFDRRPGRRDPSGIPALLWFACAAVLFITPMFGAGLAMQLTGATAGDSLRRDGMMALTAYAFAALCAGILLYLLDVRSVNAGVRFRSKDIPIGAGLFAISLPVVLAVGVASTVVYTMVNGVPPARIAHSTLDQIRNHRDNPWVYAIIGAAVLGAPLVEEITYRVFLQSAFVCVLVNRWIAILVTSTLFALVHTIGPTPVPWHAIPPIFALGFAAGIAYERTARLGVPVMIHMAFNAFNVVLALLME